MAGLIVLPKLCCAHDCPKPQECNQVIVELIGLQPKLLRKFAVRIPLIAYGNVALPILFRKIPRKHKLSSLFLNLSVPKPEGNAVILVVLESETVPKKQKAVTPPSIAVEDLLSLDHVLRRRHYELSIDLFEPPVKGNVFLEFLVYGWFGLNVFWVFLSIDVVIHSFEVLLVFQELLYQRIGCCLAQLIFLVLNGIIVF